MISVGYSQLRSAYKHHKKIAGNDSTTSHYLLLFYAVECGLKAILMARGDIRTTKDIPDKLRNHDLVALAKELRLSRLLTEINTTFHVKDGNFSHDIQKVHEAWRYGVSIRTTDQQTIVRWLRDLCEWIEENI